jgi:hypothetical protein
LTLTIFSRPKSCAPNWASTTSSRQRIPSGILPTSKSVP